MQLGADGARLLESGDVLVAARSAAMLAAKQAPHWLAHLQPLGAHDIDARFSVDGDAVAIELDVRAVSSTGVGAHALAGATAAAICIHDLAVSHGLTAVTLGTIALLRTGGDYRGATGAGTAVVIVLSDSVAAGRKPDTAGKSVVARLERAGFASLAYEVLPDDAVQLGERVRHWIAEAADVIITVGGTGLGPRDQTVETVRPLLDTEVPGLMEAARAHGQARTPYAMLSRGVAGLAGLSVVVTFPGSRRGAEETCDAIIPGLVHLVEVARMTRPHEGGYE